MIAIALAMVVVQMYVVLYEEPTLRKKFDGDDEDCCRNVGRWWPRLRGWTKG